MTKYKITYLLILINIFLYSEEKKINLINSNEIYMNEKYGTNLQILIGNVILEHEGIIMKCDSATLNSTENIFNAYNNVSINQGDSITMTCKYLRYLGTEKKGFGYENVVMNNKSSTLYTNEILFDRDNNKVIYPKQGKIVDTANILESSKGIYHIRDHNFQFLTNVIITNPRYIINSDNLLYNTSSKIAYFNGPSTIKSDSNLIYTEKGFYNTYSNISNFTKNSYLQNKEKKISGNTLYYDRNKGFGKVIKNVKIIDTLNKSFISSEYAEFFELKDSAIIMQNPVSHFIDKKNLDDTLFIYSDTIILTRKIQQDSIKNNIEIRIMRAFYNVKFYKKNLQGICDSIYSNENEKIMKLIAKKQPVIWSERNQLTADTIYLTRDTNDNMDSIKLLYNAFMISQNENDSIAFNQIKGKFIKGKFIDNELIKIWVLNNAETIYYVENENKERQGINKSSSASILVNLKSNEIHEIIFLSEPDAIMYPESKLPLDNRKLKNFNWREKERPKKKIDIFPKK